LFASDKPDLADSGEKSNSFSLLAGEIAKNPFGVTLRCHHDIVDSQGIVTSLDPTSTKTVVTNHPLAAKAHKVDLTVPLTVTLTCGALGIQRTSAGDFGDDIEGMRRVRPLADYRIADMTH